MSRFNCVNPGRPYRLGLTLLELIVVLSILAVLASVAVQSLDPIANQSRYESSQQLLDGIRSAIVKVPNANVATRSSLISGYVADTGVLPGSLGDLQVKPVALVAYGTQSFDSDRDLTNDITVSRGWNGPYLQLGAGRTTILDGWGNPLSLLNSSGSLTISSLGSDNDSIVPEDGYQADISVNIPLQSYTGDVVFRLYAISIATGVRVDATEANLLDGIASPPAGTKRAGVLFYGTNAAGGSSGTIEESMCVVGLTGSFDYRLTNTVCGKGAARAVFWVDSNNDSLISTGETILRKSYAFVFEIVPGIENRFDMELR